MRINEVSKKIHENARDKGFWDKERNIGEMLMLVVSELSEALEAHRKSHKTEVNIDGVIGWVSDDDFINSFKKNVKDTFEDEIADAVIRLFDLAYAGGFDLEKHIQAKMRFNATRERMHGKLY